MASSLPAAPLRRDGDIQHTKEPLVGVIISLILAMGSIAILASFITIRFRSVKAWVSLPYVHWLVLSIYTDSFLFVFATGILTFGLGVNTSLEVCESAILICLVFYVTTKLIYLFLVEKAHIIRASSKRGRFNSKLYLFNSFGMMGLYLVVVVINFVFRITRMDDGQCIIGMQRLAMIPLIGFDLLVNIYLTILFLIPLSSLYTFKNFQKTPANQRLRTAAFRTFLGSCCTLVSSIVNLSVLMGLDGEPGWVCLMCCNCDVLFSAIVLQWVTSLDNQSVSETTTNTHHLGNEELGEVGRKRVPTGDSQHHRHALSELSLHRMRDRRHSETTDGSSNMASSTKAIIINETIETASHDTRSFAPPSLGEHLGSRGGVYQFEKGHMRELSAPACELDEDAQVERGVPFPRAMLAGPPEVHVHVDYEVTQNPACAEEAAMGNTVTIGVGSVDDAGRRASRPA